MEQISVKDFLDLHDACSEGKDWALANCKTLDDVWATACPEWLIWVATRTGVLTDTELRLFACWSVRQVWNLLTDDRSRTAVEVSERYAKGHATDQELAAASDAARAAARAAAGVAAWAAAGVAAWAAARAAAWAAARAAAGDAARAAAWDAASDAAGVAAWAAARAAAGDAARAAAWDAASDAARAKQAEYLRANYTPNFKN